MRVVSSKHGKDYMLHKEGNGAAAKSALSLVRARQKGQSSWSTKWVSGVGARHGSEELEHKSANGVGEGPRRSRIEDRRGRGAAGVTAVLGVTQPGPSRHI